MGTEKTNAQPKILSKYIKQIRSGTDYTGKFIKSKFSNKYGGNEQML